MKRENTAILQMLLCALLWSTAGILMKWIPWNGFAVAGIRSLVAGLTFVFYMRWRRIPAVITKETLRAGLLAALTYICFSCANKLTTSANAIVLQFTSPVFVMIYEAVLFGKKIRRADLAVVLFTLAGITLFFLDQLKPGYVLGNIVAILAGMCLGGMYVAAGNLKETARFSGIMLGQFLTFLLCLPMIVLTRPVVSGRAVGCILFLGIFQLGIAYILYVKASSHCSPLVCSLLAAVEPLLNPVWVLIFDGERPGIFALVGAVIVVCSITVWCMFGQERTEPAEST